MHVGSEFGPLGHTFPHPPQLVTLERLASQPLPMSPSQLAQPLAQSSAQLPPWQLASALGALEHALPQPPQWPGSVVVSTQLEPHRVPEVQVARHA